MQSFYAIVSFEGLENLIALSNLLVILEIDGDIKSIGVGMTTFGMLGTGFMQGLATARAVDAVSRNPEAESKIRTIFILGMALTESAAIYALLLGIIIAFVA